MDFGEVEPNDFQADLITTVVILRLLPLAVRSGVGIGKTFAIALLVRVLADVVPEARVLVVMRTQRNLTRNLQPACKTLFKGRARWIARENVWEFDTGLRMEVAYYVRPQDAGEADNPIEGADVLLVFGDEIQMMPESFLGHATARARQKVYDVNGREFPAGVILMGRPSGNGWHRRRVRETVQRLGGDPKRHILEYSSHLNSSNLSSTYLANLAATYTPEQLRALVDCAEMPPEAGRVFEQTVVAPWPEGNIYDDFDYDPSRPTWLAVDLGRNTPHVLLIQQVVERLRGAPLVLDVVFAEAAPSKILTPDLVAMLLTGFEYHGRVLRVWPRGLRGGPGAALPLDGVVADPAGHDTDRHSGLSDIGLLRRPPTEDWMPGLGVPVLAPSNRASTTRARAMTIQSLLCAADGARRLALAPSMLHNDFDGRALYKALFAYGWPDIHRAEKRRKRYADRVGAVDALGYYAVERRQAPDTESADASDGWLDDDADSALWRRRS